MRFKKNEWKTIFVFSVQILLCFTATKAQIKKLTPLSDTLPKPLEEVVVTGRVYPIEKRKNPVSVVSINAKNLLETAGTNVIDALQYLPGVSQITIGPSISKPVIRGLGYNRIITVNNGLRQEGQQWGDEFGIEVDEFGVSRAEILKGPGSLRYGSDGIGGVLQLFSPDWVRPGNISGNLLQNYQSVNGLYATSLYLSGNIHGFIWDARYTHKMAHDYFNKLDKYVWNSAFGEQNYALSVGFEGKWGHSLVRYQVFNLKTGIVEAARNPINGQFTTSIYNNGVDSVIDAPSIGFKAYNYYPIIHQNVIHNKVSWENSLKLKNGILNATIGLQRNYRKEANDITQGDLYNNYFYMQSLQYDLNYVLPESHLPEITLGTNGMRQSSQDRGLVFLVPEYQSFDFGIFGIVKKTLHSFTLQGGIRFDTRNLATSDLFTDSSGNRISPTGEALHRFTAFSTSFSGISGSAGISWNMNSHWYSKLNIARGFRAPNIAESGSNGIHDGTPYYEIGDYTLKPESSLETDLSIGYLSDNISFEGNAFVNKINNYIFTEKLTVLTADPALGFIEPAPTFKYVSGNAVLSGGEITADLHPKSFPILSANIGFSLLNAIQQNQPDSTKYLPYTPSNKLVTQLKAHFGAYNRGTFRETYLFAGLEYNFKQNHVYYKNGDETITPGYTLLNIGFGTTIWNSRNSVFSIYIFGNNLADIAYQSNLSRLKYGDFNVSNGKTGVFNAGRNFSIKFIVPLTLFKK